MKFQELKEIERMYCLSEASPVLEKCINYFSLSKEELQMPVKTKSQVMIRQIIQYSLRKNTKLSLIQIGMITANKDHCTVRHSIDIVNDILSSRNAKDIVIKSIIESLQECLNESI